MSEPKGGHKAAEADKETRTKRGKRERDRARRERGRLNGHRDTLLEEKIKRNWAQMRKQERRKNKGAKRKKCRKQTNVIRNHSTSRLLAYLDGDKPLTEHAFKHCTAKTAKPQTLPAHETLQLICNYSKNKVRAVSKAKGKQRIPAAATKGITVLGSIVLSLFHRLQ